MKCLGYTLMAPDKTVVIFGYYFWSYFWRRDFYISMAECDSNVANPEYFPQKVGRMLVCLSLLRARWRFINLFVHLWIGSLFLVCSCRHGGDRGSIYGIEKLINESAVNFLELHTPLALIWLLKRTSLLKDNHLSEPGVWCLVPRWSFCLTGNRAFNNRSGKKRDTERQI